MASYADWNRFEGRNIPSSLELDDVIFQYLKPEHDVLDFGCGFGKTCFELAQRGGKSITGVDLNASGIEAARETAQELGCSEQVRFEAGDVTKLEFADSRFDFGVMQALLTALPENEHQNLLMKEAQRVLRPGALLYMAVFCQTWHVEKYRQRYLEGAEKEVGAMGAFPVYDRETGEFDYVARHYSERDIVELLLSQGFSIEHFTYKFFTTRSGNRVNGMVFVARNGEKASL